jgi:hypothetical protein
MKPSQALELHRDDIRRLALRHGVANPRVFGSTARGEDREGSDLDILVDPMAGTTLLDLGALFEALKATVEVSVDLVMIRELPPDVRPRVLAEARPI